MFGPSDGHIASEGSYRAYCHARWRRRAMITEIATSEAHGGNAGTVMFGPGANAGAAASAGAPSAGAPGAPQQKRSLLDAASNPEYSAKRRP